MPFLGSPDDFTSDYVVFFFSQRFFLRFQIQESTLLDPIPGFQIIEKISEKKQQHIVRCKIMRGVQKWHPFSYLKITNGRILCLNTIDFHFSVENLSEI